MANKRKKRRRKKSGGVRRLIGALGPGVVLLKRRKAGVHEDKRAKLRGRVNEDLKKVSDDDGHD